MSFCFLFYSLSHPLILKRKPLLWAQTRGTSILGEVRNVEISRVTQQILCSKSHDFLAVFALAHSKIHLEVPLARTYILLLVESKFDGNSDFLLIFQPITTEFCNLQCKIVLLFVDLIITQLKFLSQKLSGRLAYESRSVCKEEFHGSYLQIDHYSKKAKITHLGWLHHLLLLVSFPWLSNVESNRDNSGEIVTVGGATCPRSPSKIQHSMSVFPI